MLKSSFLRLNTVSQAPRARLLQSLNFPRSFHFSPLRASGSLFGDVTSHKPTTTPETNKDEPLIAPLDMLPSQDPVLVKRYTEEAKERQDSREKFISPQKRRLFDLNVAKNGFYKNHQIVYDAEQNKHYKLSLTESEIEVLEPSVYLKSFRIISSIKKATLVNRFVRGYNVKNAINQLHFVPKKMALELEKLLKTGLKLGQVQGLNEDLLYIHALWVGSDGWTSKRIEWRGRGRHGIITMPRVHLKAVLKTQQTRDRLAWEKEQKLNKKNPVTALNNEPLNFRVNGIYKW